ncbi:hypothetical protein [Streptomyces viridochromogenes]|uniref:deoxynucleotide monophosphate kinase family protein n=1 Tax=Streptomyces viridochromogenes TaxID=1938 RepID=UPI00069F1E6A|nr:hypothetical protein [Streptomyces viridochromogenes]KOG22006.1 hypothetical protein ADK36_13800 [Streptomyces viridochromogenes]
MKDIALTGLSRAGKDSVAARLVEAHGYVRVAFADKLKEAALKADPLIPHMQGDRQLTTRLSEVVRLVGWEYAKDDLPEVRRFLQDYGQTIREIEPQFWIRAAGFAVRAAHAAGKPVVVTDVRYQNEADFLTVNGFRLVRVERPGQTPGQHRSEREMLDYPADRTITNGGSLEALAALADTLVV